MRDWLDWANAWPISLSLPLREDAFHGEAVTARKYQSDGGPGLVDILHLLRGSDRPAEDQRMVLMAQLFFWLIGATDGHAKDFSLFLGPGGSYRLTPLYDVLSAQPSLSRGQIERKQMKLAISVGRARHYRIDGISARHFVQTGEAAGLPHDLVGSAVEDMRSRADSALERVEAAMPKGFPEELHAAVQRSVRERLPMLAQQKL